MNKSKIGIIAEKKMKILAKKIRFLKSFDIIPSYYFIKDLIHYMTAYWPIGDKLGY